MTTWPSVTGEAELRRELVRRMQVLHAIKAGALRMFDPMLANVAAAREDAKLAEVADLLGRMHGVFAHHRGATADHARRLEAELTTLGAQPSRGRAVAMGAGGLIRARVGALGGMDFGAAARDAFTFEHLEIAQANLLEQLAERIGESRSAEIVRGIRADDEEMAATIGRNWTNVLSLTLATRGLPVMRPPEPES
jgi:ferritin-like metal-binding protein YciE